VLNLGNLFYGMGTPEALQRARHCYLRYLQMQPGTGEDVLDRLFAVPFRLREIDQQLGPMQGTLPPVSDL
jgi:hypothetical protein